MAAAEEDFYVTPSEYLDGERVSVLRHEYHMGRIVAMAGASREHETIAGNLFAAIKAHLRGGGCQIFMGGMKVRLDFTARGEKYYYPDLLVTCDARDRENRYYQEHPALIVEVLSSSTESFDRGDKFADYRTIDSLQEYVLVSQSGPRMEVFRRAEGGLWVLEDVDPDGALHLKSIDLHLPAASAFEDVEFSNEPTPPPSADA